jgi:hypothetical protein
LNSDAPIVCSSSTFKFLQVNIVSNFISANQLNLGGKVKVKDIIYLFSKFVIVNMDEPFKILEPLDLNSSHVIKYGF